MYVQWQWQQFGIHNVISSSKCYHSSAEFQQVNKFVLNSWYLVLTISNTDHIKLTISNWHIKLPISNDKTTWHLHQFSSIMMPFTMLHNSTRQWRKKIFFIKMPLLCSSAASHNFVCGSIILKEGKCDAKMNTS